MKQYITLISWTSSAFHKCGDLFSCGGQIHNHLRHFFQDSTYTYNQNFLILAGVIQKIKMTKFVFGPQCRNRQNLSAECSTGALKRLSSYCDERSLPGDTWVAWETSLVSGSCRLRLLHHHSILYQLSKQTTEQYLTPRHIGIDSRTGRIAGQR